MAQSSPYQGWQDQMDEWLQNYYGTQKSGGSGSGGSGIYFGMPNDWMGGGGGGYGNFQPYSGTSLGNYFPPVNNGGFWNSIPWGNIIGGIAGGIGGGGGGSSSRGGNTTSNQRNADVIPVGPRTPAGDTPNIPTGAETGIPPSAVPNSRSGVPGLGPSIAGLAGGILTPMLLNSATGGNSGAGQFGGDLSSNLQQLLNNYLPYASQYMQQAGNYNPYQQQTSDLWSLLSQNLPSNYGQQIWGNLQGINNVAGGIGAQGSNAVNGIQQLWQQIMQNGLPNQRAIEQIVPGQLSQAGNLMGGNGNYGVQDLLSQIMQRGLPGQNTIQGMVSGQNSNPLISGANPYAGGKNYGIADLLQQVMAQGLPGQTGITSMGNSLAQQATTGGLTPEIINAYKELYLQPQQEALQGKVNQMGGGVTAVPQINQAGDMTSGSGQGAEIMRRNERDFMNQMLTQGFQNQQGLSNAATNAFGSVAGAFSPYASLAGNLGLGQGQQQLQAYNAVNQNAFPYINLANTAANQGTQNALQAFGAVPGAVYPFANLSGQLGAGSQQLGLQGLLSGTNQMGTQSNQGLGNLLQLLNQSNQYQLGQQGQQGDLARTLLSGLFGNQASEAAMSNATKQMLGQLIGSGLSTMGGQNGWLAQLIKIFGGG